MEYQQIQLMFNSALHNSGRMDLLGRPLDVSIEYVRKFIRDRPTLSMYKSSNIDPLRSRKATAEVSFMLPLRCGLSPCDSTALRP